MKTILAMIIAVLAIGVPPTAAAERRMTCQGTLTEVEDTGGDNFKVGSCEFTIDQFTGVNITDKCRLGELCAVDARVVRDTRGLWIRHAYSAKAAPRLVDAANTKGGILKAPFPAADDHTCSVRVNKQSIQCDLALYMEGGNRRRVQFNNDDSGRMVIFEGKISANDTIIVDYITVGTVQGRPKKVRLIKATGLCIPHGERTAECHAQTVDGKLFEASVEGPKTESAQKDSLRNETQIAQKTNGTDAPTISIRDKNIFVKIGTQERQLTFAGRDSDAILSPDARFVVFTRSNRKLSEPSPDDCASGPQADELRRINLDGPAEEIILVRGHSGPSGQFCSFDHKQFTSTGDRLFFLSPAGVTSSALHVFDFKRGEVRYVAPANVVIVLSFCTDEHRDQLVLSQHRYLLGGGSYDWFWLYDRDGEKELGPVGMEDESPASIIQKVQNTICRH